MSEVEQRYGESSTGYEKCLLLAMLGDEDIRYTLRSLLGVEEREKDIRELKKKVEAQKVVIRGATSMLPAIEKVGLLALTLG